MEDLRKIIYGNIKWFWYNDPVLKYENDIKKLWIYFKLWCIQNCKEIFNELEESFIEEEVNASYDIWKNR